MRSRIALAIVAFFLLFIVSSAPHRVHHLLENLPPTDIETRDLGKPSSSAHTSLSSSQWQTGIEAHASDHSDSPQSHASRHHHSQHASHHHHHTDDHGEATHDSDPPAAQSDTSTAIHGAAEPLHANAPKRDAHHDNTARTDCVVQAAALHAHLAPAENAYITRFDEEFDNRYTATKVDPSSFDPSPFSQRAPPTV